MVRVFFYSLVIRKWNFLGEAEGGKGTRPYRTVFFRVLQLLWKQKANFQTKHYRLTGCCLAPLSGQYSHMKKNQAVELKQAGYKFNTYSTLLWLQIPYRTMIPTKSRSGPWWFGVQFIPKEKQLLPQLIAFSGMPTNINSSDPNFLYSTLTTEKQSNYIVLPNFMYTG